MPLNYDAINKVLKGRMVPVGSQQFGGFGTLRTVGDMLRHRERKPKQIVFTYESDALVADAFEDIREGRAPERILWDSKFAASFHSRCRQLGVHAPGSQLNRRLITIRKNPTRYAKRGIKLSDTSVTEPHPSIVWQYAHVLEFVLVRLRNRHGVSIDDVLMEPDLVADYERMVRRVAKHLTSAELRLGALYIRKTHHVARKDVSLFDKMDAEKLESNLSDLGTLDSISTGRVPAKEGLIEVLEKGKYLYISRNENLRAVVDEFVTGPTLQVMANHFWTPRRDEIAIRVFAGSQFENISVQRWQLKLIQERDPVYNWPVLVA